MITFKTPLFKRILLVSILIMLDLSGNGQPLVETVRKDDTLIAPGLGAEGIILGDYTANLISVKGYPSRIAQFKTNREVFEDVFRQKGPVKIYFQKIYYYEKNRFMLFIGENRVAAIAGMNNYRITSDAINLGNGLDYFVFSYGNSGAVTLKKGKNRLIVYPYSGIALADDNGDNKIELYLIFPPAKGKASP